MVRKLDELGRIVIPVEIRNQYDLKEGDSLEIEERDSAIILKKHKDTYCPKCLTRCEHTDNFCGNCGLKFGTAKMHDLRTKDGKNAGIVIKDDS